MKQEKITSQTADKAAIGLSLICAIHCAAFPILVALLPAASMLGFDDEWFHRVLLFFVLPLSSYALYSGMSRHGNRAVLGIGIAGLLVLIFAAVAGHDLFGEIGERVVTVIGSALIAISHWRNFQLCQINLTHAKSD